MIDFIQDDDKLREERKKAKKNRDKYIGMSSDAMGLRITPNASYNEWDSNRRDDRNYYNDSRSAYEDDQYDGEREDSDVESSEQPSTK